MTDPAYRATPGPAPPTAQQPSAPAPCANCGVTLEGKYCHACGQPIKGMIRPLSSLTADIADSVFNLDSRILRTLGPLYFRPGFLTTEYFIGRRQRYVTPFRLFFFLTIAGFFLAQIYLGRLDFGTSPLIDVDKPLVQPDGRGIDKARTDEESAGPRDGGIDATPPAAAVAAAHPGTDAPAAARPPGAPPAAGSQITFMQFNDKAWNAKTNPLRIEWLPDIANATLNEMIGNGEINFKRALKEPKRFVALIGVLPQSLFLIMPLFAVLLKVFYLFKRRYYMEHLMVALHSHAFISLSILLFCLVSLAELAWPAITPALFWVNIAIGAWIPLYLLIMQKRVYRQSWFVTVLKWGLIGFCYFLLISTAIAIAAVLGLMLQ